MKAVRVKLLLMARVKIQTIQQTYSAPGVTPLSPDLIANHWQDNRNDLLEDEKYIH